jgi:hypothetical protein
MPEKAEDDDDHHQDHDRGSAPITVEVEVESATVKSDDGKREVTIYRWAEPECAGNDGPARWTEKRAKTEAEKRAESS